MSAKLFKNLSPDHVIYILFQEHEKIGGFLDQLASTEESILSLNKKDANPGLVTKLVELAQLLLEAEPHHQREEQVLFPALEERGITGPPQVMRMEHETLRDLKHKLLDTATKAGETEWEGFQARVEFFAKGIIQTLRAHIEKENNVLYPLALEVIQGEKVWEELQSKSQSIGPCSFMEADS